MRALITGCSSGFGLETALEFARRGHATVATMRDLTKRDRLEARADAEDLRFEVLPLDVTKPSSVARAVAAATRDTPIDVLVNNAGFQIWTSIEEATDDDVTDQFETNVVGALRVTRAVLPAMRERQAGVIVNLSSVVGMTGSPFEGLYAASKHAIEALSETLAFELRPFGVRVVVVQPGGFPTAFAANARFGSKFDATRSPYADGYRAWTTKLAGMEGHTKADPRDVACAIVDASTSGNGRLYWPVGVEAVLVDSLRRPVPFEDYEQALRSTLDWWD